MTSSPNGAADYMDSAEILLECNIWRRASRQHSVDSYRLYLDQSHLRVFADEAMAFVQNLQGKVHDGAAAAERTSSAGSESHVSPDRLKVRQLWDYIPVLKRDAEFAYRYGYPAASGKVFYALSPSDQRRLVYLGVTNGDEDVQKVGQLLMRRLEPAVVSIAELKLLLARDLCRRIVASGEPRVDEWLGVRFTDGTRGFSDEERERIKNVLGALPSWHLKRLAAIRAEESLEPWLGRYVSQEKTIELNEDWEDGTLFHEVGHVLYEELTQEQKEEWEILHKKGLEEKC
jgi:hypothetical protein